MRWLYLRVVGVLPDEDGTGSGDDGDAVEEQLFRWIRWVVGGSVETMED